MSSQQPSSASNTAGNMTFSGQSSTLSSGNMSLTIQGSTRAMKAFTITELELGGLSKWGFAEKTAYAVGFSAFSFAIGLASQLIFTNPIPEIAKGVCTIVVPAAIIIGIVCLGIGWMFSTQVNAIEKKIKEETTHGQNP